MGVTYYTLRGKPIILDYQLLGYILVTKMVFIYGCSIVCMHMDHYLWSDKGIYPFGTHKAWRSDTIEPRLPASGIQGMVVVSLIVMLYMRCLIHYIDV